MSLLNVTGEKSDNEILFWRNQSNGNQVKISKTAAQGRDIELILYERPFPDDNTKNCGRW